MDKTVTLSDGCALIQNPKSAYKLIDGEAAIVDLENSQMYSLSSVATLIWETAKEKTTVKEIVDRVEEEFEIERATAEKDCLDFIQDFVDRGLLIVEGV